MNMWVSVWTQVATQYQGHIDILWLFQSCSSSIQNFKHTLNQIPLGKKNYILKGIYLFKKMKYTVIGRKFIGQYLNEVIKNQFLHVQWVNSENFILQRAFLVE